MNEVTIGQIENDNQFNFKTKYDEEHELFHDIKNPCKYYEVSELDSNFSKFSRGFSIYSHNIRSITGHWDDILDIINQSQSEQTNGTISFINSQHPRSIYPRCL